MNCPEFAFVRVRLGKGINDFLSKARSLGNARPTFTAAYLCKVLEIADHCGAGRTLDRDGAAQE
jgi:hypothetical protein